MKTVKCPLCDQLRVDCHLETHLWAVHNTTARHVLDIELKAMSKSAKIAHNNCDGTCSLPCQGADAIRKARRKLRRAQ